ncbi:MAG: EamA family transporter [Acidobacteria bacterium]|jgi:drug/metabolite transporter (DMT)-like permease|nr:EamA family transporter [Acidobacteriota bacterium]
MTQYPLLWQILMIGCIVLWATAGDVLIASAMRNIGDLDRIRAVKGIPGAAAAVLGSPRFGLGVLCMSLSFFSMLFALSHGDLTLIGPAAASLTFVTNAIAAKFFLGENVDRRRWLAAVFVCIGVALLAH